MAEHKTRVLVVEEDRARRTMTAEDLRQHNYEVFTAEGSGEALAANARQLLLEHFCHVVVLDARLLPDGVREDPASIDLTRLYHPAGVVIHSAAADDAVAYVAGWHRMGYARHSDSPAALAATVKRQADQRQVRIDWPHERFNEEIAAALKLPPDRLVPQDLADLLGRLFPKAFAVELKPMPAMEALDPDQAATPVRRAIVLFTQEKRPYTYYLTPKVTKISSRDRIEREVANYNQFVESRLKQNRQARLEANALLWHIGAVAYEFLGVGLEDVLPFQQFYLQNPPQAVLRALRSLFLDTCETWYIGERQVENDASLYAYYNEALGIEEHLARLNQIDPLLTFPGVAEPLPNPAIWAAREGREIRFEALTTCIAHGDLHGDNFFVDSFLMTWLIDFEHTGRTHALRDFVELEADIKLRLTAYPADNLSGLAALERSLLAARSLDDMLVPQPDVAADPHLLNTFQVIAGLRHLAHLATGITDMQEYNHALLYESLFMAGLRRIREQVKQRALLSAALIVRNLTARTGLLGRQRAFPAFSPAELNGQKPAAAIRIVERQLQYLYHCYQCANEQKKLYDGQSPAGPLQEGLLVLAEEGNQLNALRTDLQQQLDAEKNA